jgi:hypothetical protein
MKRDTRRRVLWIFGIFATICPVAICGFGYGLFRSTFGSSADSLPRETELARKEGIPLEPDDLRPRPPVAASQNAATVYTPFFSAIERAAKGQQKLSAACADLAKGEATAEQLALVDQILAKVHEPLVEVASASKRPYCDFHYRYELGPALLFPEMAQAKTAAKLLIAKAHRLSDAGKLDESYEVLLAAERLGIHIGQCPSLIAALVEMSIDAMAMTEFAELLQKSSTSKSALDMADRTLAAFGPPASLHHAFRGEVIMGRVAIRSLHTLGDLKAIGGGESASEAGTGPPIPSTILKSFEASFIKRWRLIFEQLPSEPADWEGADKVLSANDVEVEQDTSIANTLNRVLFPTLTQCALAVGRQIANRNLAKTSLWLLREHLKSGRYPATLPNLGPISTDPFDGKPLKYSLFGSGFKIYSIDRDREDNGGVAPKGNRKGDLVRTFR